jgi:hypothetical protein
MLAMWFAMLVCFIVFWLVARSLSCFGVVGWLVSGRESHHSGVVHFLGRRDQATT